MEAFAQQQRLREELAQKIAAYIVDSGLSWPAARERAAADFGLGRRAGANALPSSDEIETAVRAHYALFAPEEHAETLASKRRLALHVLDLLKLFDAYLVGAVLNGAATEDSPVCIEVFTDDVKAVLAVLMDAQLDVEALDPLSSAFSRAVESSGFVIPWENTWQAIRIDVLAPHSSRSNPARREPDAYQASWEAQGRISAENLRKVLQIRSIS